MSKNHFQLNSQTLIGLHQFVSSETIKRCKSKLLCKGDFFFVCLFFFVCEYKKQIAYANKKYFI